MLQYPRKSAKQWIFCWEHDVRADKDCMAEFSNAARVKEAILNATTVNERDRGIVDDKLDELTGTVGTASYVRGHLTGFYDAESQCKKIVVDAQKAIQWYRFWGYGAILLGAVLGVFL